jgi:uncharacterized protein YkwD
MSVAAPQRLRAAFAATGVALSMLVAQGVPATSAAPVGASTAASTTVPTSTATPTAVSMAKTVLILMNRDRAAHGLKALVVETRLADLAVDRAGWMAVRGVITHDSAGGTILRAEQLRGVRPRLAGECVGWTNAEWGSASARYLYAAWKESPDHWALMMHPSFTHVGIGFSLRESGSVTYGSLVFARL